MISCSLFCNPYSEYDNSIGDPGAKGIVRALDTNAVLYTLLYDALKLAEGSVEANNHCQRGAGMISLMGIER